MKKLLTLILMFLLICGTNTENSSALWWSNEKTQSPADACEKLNKCGRYREIDCAISDLKESLATTDYKELNEVGQKCEYSIYMWTYRGLDTFPTIMNRLLEEAQRGYVLNQAVKNITKGIGGLFKTDETSSVEILLKWIKDSEYCTLDDNQISQLIKEFLKKLDTDKSSSNTAGIIAGILGAGGGWGLAAKLLTLATGGTITVTVVAAVALGGLGHSAMSWWRGSKEEKQMRKHWIEVQNYASTIEQLLTHIKNGDWKFSDSVLAQLNFDSDFYKAVVTMVDSNIEYSTETKKNFERKFKKLAETLNEIINNKNATKERTQA